MGEGLAKTAPPTTVTPPPIQEVPHLGGFSSTEYNGVPIDIFSYFDTDLSGVEPQIVDRMRDIHSFFRKETMGDTLLGIRDAELRLGYARQGESRISRLWNFIKIRECMNDLAKQQEALLSRGVYGRNY
jgi:hypothetical protein